MLSSMGLSKAESIQKFERTAGVSLERTRLVLDNGVKSSSIGINNKNPTPMVVTAWVVDLEGKPTEKFVVSPAIFQLGGNNTGKTSVRLVEELPKDRESVFWLKVNTAQAGESKQNSLKVAIGNKIKIFYRPEGLDGDAKYAASNVIWRFNGDKITATNPTALSVSVSDLCFDTETKRVAEMILPFTTKSWSVNKDALSSNKKSFIFVDEYGGFKEIPMTFKVK